MGTITIHLPETLAQEVEARGISQERLEQVIADLVRAYLLEIETSTVSDETEWTDGATFARRVISNNRELFEELAQL